MQLADRIKALYFSAAAAQSDVLPEPSIISFDIETLKNLLLILLNVTILVIILALVLYKPVRAFMDKRKAGIQSDLNKAKEAQESAEQLQIECEAQRKQIDKEREQILTNAHKKALDRSESIIVEAREEAENIRKHTLDELEEERIGMQAELKRQLIELSVLLAERFVAVSMDEKSQEQYVDDAIADWEEKLWLE